MPLVMPTLICTHTPLQKVSASYTSHDMQNKFHMQKHNYATLKYGTV